MLWTALILGFAGSLHCAGMCGPLMLALPTAGPSRTGFVAGRMAYQVGRVLTYTLLGVGFGLLGRSLAVIGLQRWVSLAAGVLMLAGLAAALPRGAALPVFAMVRWLKSAAGALLRRRTLGSLALLGALNGLLPCGLVYAAAAAATSMGSWPDGIAYMAIFGLGTVPMMLGLSLSSRSIPPAWRLHWQRLVPVSLAVVATLLILRGLALGIPYLSPDLAASGAACCH
jgi:sulfite exporter TauE/SafE